MSENRFIFCGLSFVHRHRIPYTSPQFISAKTRLRNDLLCVGWDVKPSTLTVSPTYAKLPIYQFYTASCLVLPTRYRLDRCDQYVKRCRFAQGCAFYESRKHFFTFMYFLFIYLFNVWRQVSSTISKCHKDNWTNMLKMITGQNDTAAYVIPQNQYDRVNIAMHKRKIIGINHKI